MKQKTKLIIIMFAILLIFSIPKKLFAINSLGGYSIESYNIYMNVNENNTFDITETISVNFTGNNKHGIFRKIPLRNTLTRLDGTRSSNNAKISKIVMSDPYTSYNENGYKVLKIGSSNKTVYGNKTYTIKYNYNIGKDPLKDVDELYFNLIGDEWDTDIKSVTFTINMPKAFDKTKLGFSSGYIYSNDETNIYYTVDGNVIKGKTKNKLSEGKALTVRLILPEGYFVGASNNLNYWSIIKIFISIGFVMIAFVLWQRNGKDDNVIETLEFYPPDNLNSADVGFLYKGYSDKKDIVSLLIYLANKGYLKIEEFEEKTLKVFTSKNFRITKLKEYDGNNEDERDFFNGLFLTGDEVTRNDLYNRFYLVLNRITHNINRKENKEKIFEKASLSYRIPIVIMLVVLMFIIGGLASLLTSIYLIGLFIMVPIFLVFTKPSISTTIIACCFSIVIAVSSIVENAANNGIYGTTVLLELIFENLSMILLIVFLELMQKRTTYGAEMLGRIKGFKSFLENAEKPRLERLVMENPEYFYDILPYTYVLGVSNIWMQKFEDIALEAPSWYCGYNNFDNHSFNRFMTNTIITTMSSNPSSRGGGSSGGGSGGGGGGSW